MRPHAARAWTIRLLLCAAFGAHSADAGVIGIENRPAGGFDLLIDFDLNPLDPGVFFEDDVDLLDQYIGVPFGVRFRDALGSFDAPLGRAPGEIDDDRWFSAPNSLETGGGEVFVLFETPVLSAGAFVLVGNGDDSNDDSSDDDSDDSSDGGDDDGPEVFLDLFDVDLQLVDTVGIDTDEDGWRFLGFTGDVPISSVRFRTDAEEFNLDDLGALRVPEPAALPVLLVAGLLLLRHPRRGGRGAGRSPPWRRQARGCRTSPGRTTSGMRAEPLR